MSRLYIEIARLGTFKLCGGPYVIIAGLIVTGLVVVSVAIIIIVHH